MLSAKSGAILSQPQYVKQHQHGQKDQSQHKIKLIIGFNWICFWEIIWTSEQAS